MRLTRRDALAALAGAGIVGGGAGATASRLLGPDDSDGGGTVPDWIIDALVATAEVVYPSEVSGVRDFVETYSEGRIAAREDYQRGVREAIGVLDEQAETWYDQPFADLRPGLRDALLRNFGVAAADPAPNGTSPEQVRFYVVNELQYALYTSPAGGRLLGIENPQGHAGGIDSYQRGPHG